LLVESGSLRKSVTEHIFSYKMLTPDFRRPVTEPLFIVLAGPTGSGKTFLLDTLQQQGYPVIHLSQLARSNGSVFSPIHIQPGQADFDRALTTQFQALQYSGLIFTESESRQIGRLTIPAWFYEHLQNGYIVHLQIPRKERVRYLIEVYGQTDTHAAIAAIRKLSTHIGHETAASLIQLAEQHEIEKLVDALLDHYDQGETYRYFQNNAQLHFKFDKINPQFMATQITQQLAAQLL
jgi:tRNA 2-selenouridine synthase